jgi:hypothetical protein
VCVCVCARACSSLNTATVIKSGSMRRILDKRVLKILWFDLVQTMSGGLP